MCFFLVSNQLGKIKGTSYQFNKLEFTFDLLKKKPPHLRTPLLDLLIHFELLTTLLSISPPFSPSHTVFLMASLCAVKTEVE